MPPFSDQDAMARKILLALDERRQIAGLGADDPAFDVARAYAVAARVTTLREERGERRIGRKIGFTNRTIWDEYGVHAPIWGHVYDTTRSYLADAGEAFDLAGVVEPRIEPEIVLSLARAPEPGMDERELLGCVGSIAHAFEIVQSLFAGWRFTAPDTIAAFGLHGALLLGPPQHLVAANRSMWFDRLSGFDIALLRNGEVVDRGNAANVLGGGPLAALRHLVELLANDGGPPLAPGEIVSTGTLTRALPIAPGETWSTELSGVPLKGISVTFG